MTIHEPTRIDMIMRVRDATPPRAALVIVDPGDIANSGQRLKALHRKLAVYLDYVVSGTFASDHPDFAGQPPLVRVICTGAPPTPAMREVDAVRHTQQGIRLPVEVFTQEEFLATGGAKPAGEN